ncbi:MAG: hypothetical protein FGM14_01125 [Flavobacteriales bacterium]|nr:hypothetical protein [Flavobacteriales bacterium]
MKNYILGIHCGHDATAVLMDSFGKVIAGVAEERISRLKYHAGFPYLSIKEVLRIGGVEMSDITHISSSSKRIFYPTSLWYNEYMMSEDLEYKAKYDISNPKKNDSSVFENLMKPIKSKFTSSQVLSNKEVENFSRKLIESKLIEIGFKDFKLDIVEHHQTHATGAFFHSGVENALILTLDGSGDGLCASISIGKNGEIERIASISSDCSLGRVYSEITRFLGFKRNRHEGKITGLAAYGNADRLYNHLTKFIRFNPETENFEWDEPVDSRFVRKIKTVKRILVDESYGNPHMNFMNTYLKENFDAKIDGNDLSAAVQKITEDVTVDLVKHFLKKFPNKNIVLAGGVFANVKVNQKVGEIDGVEYVYIHQNMGDGGCATGAALESWSILNRGKIPELPNDVYYGPSYTDKEILEELEKTEGIVWEKSENIEINVAKLIHENVIVGRFYGRMEYGPRSLGNRSILAKTTDKTINDWLNKRLNRTEFMPFAPAIYDQQAASVLINYNESSTKYASEFMTVTYDVVDKWVDVLQAAVHVDGTARPQVVTATNNPEFHKILAHYYELSGIPGVINTSFNSHEEPIVMTPIHAIRSLLQGTVDVLAIGNYLVKKNTK